MAEPQNSASAIFDIVNDAAIQAQNGELVAALNTLRKVSAFPDEAAQQVLAGTDVLANAVDQVLGAEEDAKHTTSDADEAAVLLLFRQAIQRCGDAKEFAGVSVVVRAALGATSLTFSDPWPNLVHYFEVEFRRRKAVLYGDRF